MNSFLYGWRRKVGVMTLLLACLFMAGWLRSQRVFDVVQFPAVLSFPHGIGSATMFSSARGIVWASSRRVPSRRQRLLPYWQSFDSSHNSFDLLIWDHDNTLNGPTIVWKLKRYGIGYGEIIGSESTAVQRTSVFLFPYWSVVLPLTLVSTWLILRRPRRTIEKHTLQPL